MRASIAALVLIVSANAQAAIDIDVWRTWTPSVWTGFYWEKWPIVNCRSWSTQPGSDYVGIDHFVMECHTYMHTSLPPIGQPTMDSGELSSPQMNTSGPVEVLWSGTECSCYTGNGRFAAYGVVFFDAYTGFPAQPIEDVQMYYFNYCFA